MRSCSRPGAARFINETPFGSGGFLNKGRNLRIGLGDKGSERVFRITGDLIGGRKIDLINFRPKRRLK